MKFHIKLIFCTFMFTFSEDIIVLKEIGVICLKD